MKRKKSTSILNPNTRSSVTSKTKQPSVPDLAIQELYSQGSTRVRWILNVSASPRMQSVAVQNVRYSEIQSARQWLLRMRLLLLPQQFATNYVTVRKKTLECLWFWRGRCTIFCRTVATVMQPLGNRY